MSFPPNPPAADAGRQPMFNLPPLVAALIGVCAAIYVVMLLVPVKTEAWILIHLGFSPAYYRSEWFGWESFVGPFSHQFLHGGVFHLIINVVMLAAFGAGAERALGARRTLGLFLVCGVVGAFTHLAIYPSLSAQVVGASGAISGLFGAVLRLMASRPLSKGGVRLLPVALIWIGFAVLVGFAGAPGTEGVQIAWAAHVGGFVAGLALLPLFMARQSGPRVRP